MTYSDLAIAVAKDFRETMDEFGFDTFNEMSECYCWTSEDIREEVSAILTAFAKENNVNCYMSEDGDADIYLNGDFISYRAFNSAFRKEIKRMA